MAVFTISATVNEQDIALSLGDVKLVSGAKDLYQIQFTFSEEWDSYTKKVVFENPVPKRAVIEVLLSGTNIVTIPIRSLANPSFLRIGVYGVGTNNEVMPTVWSENLRIFEGTYQGYENPAAPDPDVYNEILAAMAGKTDVATFDDTMEGIFKSIFNYHDNKPYLTRTAPENIRTLLTESIIGASFAWNQLVDTGTTAVTITNGHKYLATINEVQTIGASDGASIAVDGSRGDQFHNLTVMFGSTIADYVYGLEQATAGSGIAWLQSYGFFTEDYYPYDAGSIQSVHTSNHSGYALDPIDSRGIPKLDANNNLYYDGDIYESDGTVTRKYGIINLGNCSWSYVAPTETRPWGVFVTSIAGRKYDAGWDVIGIIASYVFVGNWSSTNLMNRLTTDKTFGFQATNINLRIRNDAYTDTVSFKAAMNGVYLIYPLDTPTTDTAEPFAAIQTVPETEYYTDNRDVPIPVGHESTYLVATPETPTADGTYTLACTVTDGIPSYEWQGSAAQTLNAVRPTLNLGAVQPVDINTETESAEEGDDE